MFALYYNTVPNKIKLYYANVADHKIVYELWHNSSSYGHNVEHSIMCFYFLSTAQKHK